jgi:hypothetical protein
MPPNLVLTKTPRGCIQVLPGRVPRWPGELWTQQWLPIGLPGPRATGTFFQIGGNLSEKPYIHLGGGE